MEQRYFLLLLTRRYSRLRDRDKRVRRGSDVSGVDVCRTQTAQLQTDQASFAHRWMRYFFTEDVSPDNRSTVDLQRRAVWIGLALILQSLNIVDQAIGTIDGHWPLPLLVLFNTFLPLALTLGCFFAMWMAFRPGSIRRRVRYAQYVQQHPAPWQRFVLVMTLLLSLVGSVVCGITLVACFSSPSFSNDGTSLDTNAAILLLQGRNPYTDSNILDVAHRFSIAPNWTTPLRRGQFANRLDYPPMNTLQSAFNKGLKTGQAPEFESKVSYPVLSFLTLLPFAFFKHYNVLPFYLLSYLLIVIFGWKVARPELRPWVLLLAIANIPMWSSILGGNLDILYCLLIILAWLQRGHRWKSAVFLGLAVATKQIAWLFIPFYMIMIWRTAPMAGANDAAPPGSAAAMYKMYDGLKEALYRAVIAASIGLAINLPFIIWNPQAWLTGILAPIMDPMFPLGIGFINLSVTHLLPYFPYWVYAVLEGGAMFGSLAWYWRICRQRPEAAMLLALAPLFFAWRSLPSYFYCTAFPLFVLMVAKIKPALPHVVVPARRPFLPALEDVRLLQSEDSL